MQGFGPFGGKDFFIPRGYRFIPSDRQLVIDYLKTKILGATPPLDDAAIKEIDVYNVHPDELPINEFLGESARNGELHYFTYRDPKRFSVTENLTREDGYWKVVGGDAEVVYQGNVVGFKRKLIFCWSEELMRERGCWFIHEYRVNPATLPGYEENDDLKAKAEHYVLCKVRLKELPIDGSSGDDSDHGVSDVEDDNELTDANVENSSKRTKTDHNAGLMAESNVSMDQGEYNPALTYFDSEAPKNIFPKFLKY